MEIKNLGYFHKEVGSVEDWHEFHSPVSIVEATDLYHGCFVRNGEDYLEVRPSDAFARDVYEADFELANVRILIPAIMPKREDSSHFLPFECVLRDVAYPLYGTTVPTLLEPKIKTNVFACDVRIENGYQIEVCSDVWYSRYIMVYSSDQRLEDSERAKGLINFRLELAEKMVYCILAPVTSLELLTPFEYEAILDMMENSQRYVEDCEYKIAHAL